MVGVVRLDTTKNRGKYLGFITQITQITQNGGH
jgi:hypothetical protein